MASVEEGVSGSESREMIRFPAAVQTVPCKTGGKSGRQTKESKVSPGFYLCSTFFVCSFLLEIFFLFYTGNCLERHGLWRGNYLEWFSSSGKKKNGDRFCIIRNNFCFDILGLFFGLNIILPETFYKLWILSSCSEIIDKIRIF